MPALPLKVDGSYARTIGIMLFPNAADIEQKKASAVAAKVLAGGVHYAGEAADTLPGELLRDFIRLDGGTLFETGEIERRRSEGVIIGELVKLYFGLARQRPEVASWQNAVRSLEKAMNTSSGSSFKAAKAQMLPAAHLWGAWVLRGMRLNPQPDLGYTAFDDFETFIEEAEELLAWGLEWQQDRAKSEPPFGGHHMWRAPSGWTRSRWDLRWPPSGENLDYDLPPELVGDLRPSGRPVRSA